METIVIGDNPIEAIVFLAGLVVLYALSCGGRPAKKIADEMYQMYISNNGDGERWKKISAEASWEQNLGVLWFVPGLFGAWFVIVQLGMNLLAGWAVLMFFTWLSIVKPKSQGDYYAQMFDDPALMGDRRWRKGTWSLGYWVLLVGFAVGVYWFATNNGIFLGAR